MSVIDQVLAIFTPYECLGCAIEGSLLCAGCIQQLSPLPEECYRCQQPSAGSLTCGDCLQATALKRVLAATAYKGLAKEIVGALKFSGAQMAAKEMAAQTSALISNNPIIMPVPTATSRVRGRGYDQAGLLARELSRQAQLPYLDCLVRSGQTHQVGASRVQRLQQLHGAFRVRKPQKLQGRYVLLVDDVLTTGATLEAAARVLQAAGVKHIEAAVFARA